MGFPVLADRFDPACLGIRNGDQPQRDGAAVMSERDDVRRIQRQPRGRQTERSRLPPGPGFHQRAAATAFSFLWRDRHRKALRGNPRRIDGDPAGLNEGGVVILVRPRHLPFERLRQLGFLRTREFQNVTLASRNKIVLRYTGNRCAPPHDETDQPLGLDRVKPEMPRQRGDRGAGGFQCADCVALYRAPEAGNVDPGLRHFSPQAEMPDERRERHRAKPSGQPVPEPPVRPVRPDFGQRREERVRPRVPGPGGAFRHMHHPAAVNR